MKEIFRIKPKIDVLKILKFLAFFVLFFVSLKVKVGQYFLPLSFGFFVSLLWCEENMIALSLLYILADFLSFFSLIHFLICLSSVSIILIAFLLHKKFKKPIKIWLLCIYTTIALLPSFFLYYSSPEMIFSNLIGIFLCIIVLICSINIFKYIFLRGTALKLTIDEIVSLGLILIVISMGLNEIVIFHINMLYVFAPFLILLITYIYPSGAGVITGTLIGLSIAINSGNFSVATLYSVIGVVALIFKNKIRYFSVLAVVLTEIVFGLYFKIYGEFSIFNTVSLVIGEVLFLVINNNNLKLLQIMLGGQSDQTIIRNVVNRSRDSLCKRMYEISNVFNDMHNIFMGLIRGILPAEEAKLMLVEEVQKSVCKDCPERHKCWRVLNSETNDVFNSMIGAGLERGKVLILDVPPFLSSRCNHIATIINILNQLLVSFKQYTTMVSNMDSSRVLIANQLEGVSKLMRVLADETMQNVSFDVDKEKNIIEELNYENIVCSEAILYEKSKNSLDLTLIVRTKDIDKTKIEKACSRVCKSKMIVTDIASGNLEGFNVVNLKTAPKYDVVFGCSGACKYNNSVSGDNYSFIRLNNDKILLAICDGMGNGQTAKNTSDMAIGLIENFYKAGYENEIVMSSVNKLLTLNADEKFSAIDICVVDLQTSYCDFVKLGSPDSFVSKLSGDIDILSSNALPLGILDEVKPTILTKLVTDDDMIILCSDGVNDSFGSTEEMSIFLHSLNIKNPQTLCDELLKKCMENYGNEPKDDCTILCARVFPRI